MKTTFNISCSFCGGRCGEHACNFLDKIAHKSGTTHDAVCNVISNYQKKKKTGFLSLAAINKISPTLMNEFIEISKNKS